MNPLIKEYNDKLDKMEELLSFFEDELKDNKEHREIVESIKYNLKKLRLIEK